VTTMFVPKRDDVDGTVLRNNIFNNLIYNVR
jgi:hypothetical protein